MNSEYLYDCPFRQMDNTPMTSDNMQMPMFQQGPGGMPIISAGMPALAPGGTTAIPPFPTPQAVQGMNAASGQFQDNFEMQPGAPVQLDINYTQGYLRTQIGKRMLVSFLIGTNTYQDRTGTLEKVGISYIILREPEGTQLLCDIYSIKFVRIFQ